MLSQTVERSKERVSQQTVASAPRRPPHVVMVVLAGCERTQLGCFGRSSDTPAIDRLARAGLRFAAAVPGEELPHAPGREELERSLGELQYVLQRVASGDVAVQALAFLAQLLRTPDRRMFLELEFDASTRAELQHADAELGRVLGELEAIDQLDQTLVLVTASHPPDQRELLLMCWPERIAAQGELRLRAAHPFSTLATLLAAYQGKHIRPHPKPQRRAPLLAREPVTVRKYIYRPTGTSMPEGIPTLLLTRPHRISAAIVTDEHARGTVLCHGSASGGYALYVEDRHLHYVLSYLGGRTLYLRSRELLPSGRCEVRLEYQPVSAQAVVETGRAAGRVRLLLGGRVQASVRMPLAMPLLLTMAGSTPCGNAEERVVRRYFEQAPFAFGYDLRRVVVEVGAELKIDPRAELRAVLSERAR